METDFLIIGGGIAGISLAARLAPFGKVILLEAEAALAYHASGRSAALYEPNYGPAPIVALSKASGAYFHRSGTILSPRGMMIVAKTGDKAAFEADAKSMNLAPITLDEAKSIIPILNTETVAHVALADHAWDIDTDRLVQDFARSARAAGAQILTGAAVTGLKRLDAGWQVITAKGAFRATVVINAAGAWVDEIARMAGISTIGFTPMRRSMARIPAPAGLDVSHWPMLFGAGESWYAKPDAGALIVSPAEEHLVAPHDAYADDMVLAEGLARYEEMVTEPVTRMLANWAGLRTFAPDRTPVIGYDPEKTDFFWLAGQGGYGFQSCPAASALAADLILRRDSDFEPTLIASVSPGRFAQSQMKA